MIANNNSRHSIGLVRLVRFTSSLLGHLNSGTCAAFYCPHDDNRSIARRRTSKPPIPRIVSMLSTSHSLLSSNTSFTAFDIHTRIPVQTSLLTSVSTFTPCCSFLRLVRLQSLGYHTSCTFLYIYFIMHQLAYVTIADNDKAERKARQYEELLAQQRRIQAQMDLIDPETRREVDEVKRLEQDIHRFTSGHQSEPTTPPEYYSYPSAVSRPNRYSSSALTSPPGLANRPARSGSQLTSPPASYVRPFSSHAAVNQLPSKSVPGSRRNSDEEEEEDDYTYGFSDSRAAAKYVLSHFMARKIFQR